MDISQKGEEGVAAAEGGAGDTRLSKTLPLASKTGAGSGAFKHFPPFCAGGFGKQQNALFQRFIQRLPW